MPQIPTTRWTKHSSLAPHLAACEMTESSVALLLAGKRAYYAQGSTIVQCLARRQQRASLVMAPRRGRHSEDLAPGPASQSKSRCSELPGLGFVSTRCSKRLLCSDSGRGVRVIGRSTPWDTGYLRTSRFARTVASIGFILILPRRARVVKVASPDVCRPTKLIRAGRTVIGTDQQSAPSPA